MLNEDFNVLGLSPDASNTDLTAAYRRLSKALHPDKTGGCKVREERFKRVAEAYHRIRANRPHDAEADRTRAKPNEREQRRHSTEEASRAAQRATKPEASPQEKARSQGVDRPGQKAKRHGFEGRPVRLTDTGLGVEMVLAGAVPVVARTVLLLRRQADQMPNLSESLGRLESVCQSWARARTYGIADQEIGCLSDVLSTLRQSLDKVVLGDGPLIDEEAASEILLNRSAVTRYAGHLQHAREETAPLAPGARALRLSRAAAGVCSETPDVRAAALAVVARAAARSLAELESAAVGAAISELVTRAVSSSVQDRPARLFGVLDQAAQILHRPKQSASQSRLAQANIDTVLNWAAAADHMASNNPRGPDVHRPEPPSYPSP